LCGLSERIDVLANIAAVMNGFVTADVYTDKEWDRVMGVQSHCSDEDDSCGAPNNESEGKGIYHKCG
jgi:hypothetical protein